RPTKFVPARSCARPIWGSTMPLLEIDGLHARYDYAPVLQGISLKVDVGEIVSIFGRNGAGKTTALRAIMGWLRPSAGTIRFAGEALGVLEPRLFFPRGD